ncbi:MAG TPA: hypothetical protein VL197_11305 [Nitrospirota bacterium]|nr:hypothetical protein [Nitrospirota bacterium]
MMKNIIPGNARTLTLAALAAVLMLSGCALPKVHLDYDQRAAKIKTVAILGPEVDAYEVHFGAREKHDDWTGQASRNLVDAATKELSARGFSVTLIPRKGKDEETVEEVYGLFDSIAWSYRAHVTPDNSSWRFPHKMDSLDYSVGPLDDLLAANHAEALLLIDGFVQRSDNPLMQRGSLLELALADRSGTLLWFDRRFKPYQAFTSWDPTDPDHANVMVRDLFKSLPEVKR